MLQVQIGCFVCVYVQVVGIYGGDGVLRVFLDRDFYFSGGACVCGMANGMLPTYLIHCWLWFI